MMTTKTMSEINKRNPMISNKTIGHSPSCRNINPHRWALKTSRPAVFSCGYSHAPWFLEDRQPLQEALAGGLRQRVFPIRTTGSEQLN